MLTRVSKSSQVRYLRAIGREMEQSQPEMTNDKEEADRPTSSSAAIAAGRPTSSSARARQRPRPPQTRAVQPPRPPREGLVCPGHDTLDFAETKQALPRADRVLARSCCCDGPRPSLALARRGAFHGSFAPTFEPARRSEIIAKLSQKYHFYLHSNYLVISD